MANKTLFWSFLWLKNPFNQRSTKDYVRNYKLFMQNEPKFQKVKLNVTNLLTREYVQMDTWSIRKKQSQTKPNKPKFKKAKMNVTSYITKEYENKLPIRAPKKQSQTSKRQKSMQTSLPQRIMKKTSLSGPKKQTQFKPKQTQYLPAICVAGQSQYMLPRMTINPRPNSLAHYPDEIEAPNAYDRLADGQSYTVYAIGKNSAGQSIKAFFPRLHKKILKIKIYHQHLAVFQRHGLRKDVIC